MKVKHAIFLSLMLFSCAITANILRLKDPTRPVYWEAPAGINYSTNYLLTAIFAAPEADFAVINNQILKTGDVINGAKVLKIKPNLVYLSKRGKRITLRLLPWNIKKWD